MREVWDRWCHSANRNVESLSPDEEEQFIDFYNTEYHESPDERNKKASGEIHRYLHELHSVWDRIDSEFRLEEVMRKLGDGVFLDRHFIKLYLKAHWKAHGQLERSEKDRFWYNVPKLVDAAVLWKDAASNQKEFSHIPFAGAKPMADSDQNRRAVYQELCNSYRAIDDFRSKLLGFLPLASGTGVFLLLDKLKDLDTVKDDINSALLMAAGVFGLVITLGLFAYELYGIKKCGALIAVGKQLEGELHSDGQFCSRPREVCGFINEPFAAGIIYSGVLAAWICVILIPWHFQIFWLITVPVFVFLVSFAGSLCYNLYLKNKERVSGL